MGDSKLCLLLLLSTSALAFAQDRDVDQSTCLLAQRYKTLHKYTYQYEAESLNAINGGSQLKNGPRASCTVEIEVPQTCSFIVRTTGCRLSEVVDMDANGNPVFGPAPTSDAFADEMSRYPLKFVVEGVYDVKLYPEEGETTTTLNIKRGIISALAVPLLDEQKNKNMPTIHGMCKTYYTVNAREDIATDISLNRDLSSCDKFAPIKDHTSPLALISGMHYPLAQLVRGSQICNYKFDNEKKHMTSGSCTEKHILIPFSHKGEYGVTNVGKQDLTLVTVSPHNDRVFDHSDTVKDLHMEAVEDKSTVQDKDGVLSVLRELATLPETQGERRAHLFHKLVSMVRGMKAETLSPTIPEALVVSHALTYQVLAQCGTPECTSAIMQILRTFDADSLKVDAAVFAMGLVSNPSSQLINDMLQMAKYKNSKPIMYAMSNAVKRFYAAEKRLTPEIYSVAEFLAAKLGDCSGDKDQTFLTLRVTGDMSQAVVPASPALRAGVFHCVNQPSASLTVQQAAIQVFRLVAVPDEGREVFMKVLLDDTSPTQKRIAAYLVLMKDPKPSELTQMVNALANEQDTQVKNFVHSHITNILNSNENQELIGKIRVAMQGNEIGPIMFPSKLSRNYKLGSLEGNMIFDGTSYLPKEAMLEMTLKAFGYELYIMEVGMEGKGFEPTVEALFGENGFFPDTVLKTMYFVSDNMPRTVNDILRDVVPALEKNRMTKQASQNLMREVGRNLNKLVRELKTAQSPEAMVYLKLLGNELGYLRTNDMEEMAYSAAMMFDSMFKMFPSDIMKALMTKTDNTIFAHYIFMDNEFFLPTLTGVPLRIALSGTFTPGIKGGLKIARDMSEVSFMPSAGIEFVTQVGSHIPEYVNSGLEMHTNMFHESGLKAKISFGRDNVKLTIPAPTTPTKIIKITNTLVAVTKSEVMAIPPMVMDKVDVSKCSPFFTGMKYCTALEYTDAFSQETSPYFPITGNSKFIMELQPTNEVTEYTATVAYELLREGEEGRQKVDSVTFALKAEGAEPTEARAIMKYNRRKNVITADIQIPDYDVEAGLRLGIVDGNTRGKGTHSVSLDFINKNIPQLSLVGRANLKAMKEGMLQVQLLIPSISTDATVTANMKREDELELELKSEVKIMDATSEQKIAMKYDASKIEFEVKSDVNAKTTILPNADILERYGNELLDMKVGQSDMKVRQVFKKFVEAANNYMEMYGDQLPYIQDFRVPDVPEISLPETLFLTTEAKAVYHFNNERFTISIPLLLGGKSTDELNFPQALTTPSVVLPQFGLEIGSMEIPIPELVIPESIILSIPLFGKAMVSTVMTSNLYDMEASVSAGKNVIESPSYSATFGVTGTSPFDILSLKIEGSGMVANTDSIKAYLKSSLAHKFLDASISIVEDATITDKINLKSSSKMEAQSPLGLSIVFEHTGMVGMNTDEISADSNLVWKFMAGPMYGSTISTQSFTILPFNPNTFKMDSTIQFESPILIGQNVIATTLVNNEFTFTSKTNDDQDTFIHVAELSFKDMKLSLKCGANANALGMKIRNQAEASAGAGEVIMRMETNADHSENRVYALQTVILDVNGLAVSSDASVKLLANEATHKAILKMNKEGLTTSGTTTLQSPLSLENTFTAGLDSTRATLSTTNKAAMYDIKFDNANTMTITLSSLDFKSTIETTASEYASYTHDIAFDLQPYTAFAKVNNNLKLLAANFINEAQLQAELFKMDLTGNLKASYGEEEIKHTYQISYADVSADAKCSSTGKLFGTHMSHNTELQVVGLAAKLINNARFNSQPMSFQHTIQCSIVPFDFNLDAMFNADGDMTMYGKHSGQLYGKFLFRAQPLAFASSQECRASVTQKLDNGLALETAFYNKIDTTLSLQEQKTSFKMNSKMNEHAFNQGIDVYNTAETAGIEVFGTMLTNILNTASAENQEFTISSFLKYDKSTNSRIIQLPLFKSLTDFLEVIKGVVVYMGEAVQDSINSREMRATLEALSQRTSDVFAQMNTEGKAIQLKQYFNDFIQNYSFSLDDVESFLREMEVIFKRLLADLRVYIQSFAEAVQKIIVSGTFPDSLIQNIQDLLNTIDEEYGIKNVVVFVIGTVRDMLQEIDLEQLKGSSIAFLYDIDAKYEIRAQLQTIMSEIQELIENFDMAEFAADLKRGIASINLRVPIEILFSDIPTEIFNDITYYIRNVIRNFDIVGQVNSFCAKIRELIVKFEADKKIQVVLEKAVELVKQLKIEETLRAVAKIVVDADIPTKFMEVFQSVINYLKTTEVKDVIQKLNIYIETTVKSMDYNNFVDLINLSIAECTTYVNKMIKALEIPQKLEAMRDFVNTVLSTVRELVERLREIRVAEMIKTVKDIIDESFLDQVKRFTEVVKEKITNLDVKPEISFILKSMSKYYTRAMDVISETFSTIFEMLKTVAPDQKIFSEFQQIIDGLCAELKKAEVNIPSFIIPFTDLVVPSMKFSMDKLGQFEIPTQFDIPEFTILQQYTVKATTISFDDIKQRIIDLIDFIVNFDIKMLDVDTFFGDLTLNYLPSMPEITFPEITLREISFPTIPGVNVETLVKSLQIPEMKLPTIPSEIMIPTFGKLYGEFRLQSPIYIVRTSAEFQNSTENAMTPQFTGILTSQGISSYDLLSYKFDANARIAIPRMSRIVLAETVKLNHPALGVEHQASVTFYGQTAQAQAKTTIKVSTAPYTAIFMNAAFIGMAGGMTGSLDTSYTHVVDLPFARSEITATQKSVVRQNGLSLILQADNAGNGKLNYRNGNHNSKLSLSLTPRIVTLAFSGDTDALIKMKQEINAELSPFTYFKFNVRNEAEAPIIKNSLFVATGLVSIPDIKAELKVNHDTELYDGVSGVVSNGLNFVASPDKFAFEFQNKGNVKVNIFKSLAAKIDLQNDYSAKFSPDHQQMNTVMLARVNQYKIFYNFTLNNDMERVGISVAMESEANLDFLTYPISIPEIDLPFGHIPAIENLNLYEQTGLNNILTTTEQTVNLDVDIGYQKSQDPPYINMMYLFQLPSVGNLNSELSFKSAIINLNVSAGLYTEDDLVFRLAATTASVFDSLKATLDGTASLTTKRGIKLANSLSLENSHIEGTHDSTISMNTDTFETAISVGTLAKVALPILNMEANQKLVADTKTKANAVSTLSMRGVFNIPMVKAAVKAEAEHSLKLEGTFEDVSMETITRGNMDVTMGEDFMLLGVLDNEANMYLNNNGLRSTSKIIGDVKLNRGTVKVIGMDVNENLAIEASMKRVYADLKYASNNEVKPLNTKGKHIVQATIDFVPTSSLAADIEIGISQPSNMGVFTIFEKTVAEMTADMQKISTNMKFKTDLYSSTMEAEVEGSAPVFKVTVKSSGESIIPFLQYNLDASTNANFENEALDLISKAALTHVYMTMDVNHVITQALRSKRQAHDSASRHTLNVDIASPIFSNVNLRYAARRDGISASVSASNTGFLGIQFSGRVPFPMSARVYARYPSAPDVDVDFLAIRSSPLDDDTMNLKIIYNMEASKTILAALRDKLPSITTLLTMIDDEYMITRSMAMLQDAVVNYINEVYNDVISYDVQLSQLSVFFRNTLVRFQRIIQALLETQFPFPGSNQMTTLPEILKGLTEYFVVLVDFTTEMIYESMGGFGSYFVEQISGMTVYMPSGEAVTGAEIVDQVKIAFRKLCDELKNIDTMLVEMGKTFKAVVEKTQEFVDSLKSDYLDAVFIHINTFYRKLVTAIKNEVDKMPDFSMENFSRACETIIDTFIHIIDQVTLEITSLLQQAPNEVKAYISVEDAKLKIDLPFHFQM